MTTLNLPITFVTIECADCAMPFAVSREWEERRREDHKRFFCPNGHSLSFNGPSDAEKRAAAAEKEAKRLQNLVERERTRTEFWQREQEQTKRQLTATKGQLTKTRKRAASGVCPVDGCKRSFVDVARHVRTKHPEYAHDHE